MEPTILMGVGLSTVLTLLTGLTLLTELTLLAGLSGTRIGTKNFNSKVALRLLPVIPVTVPVIAHYCPGITFCWYRDREREFRKLFMFDETSSLIYCNNIAELIK